MNDEERIAWLISELPRLSTNQLVAIGNIVSQFARPYTFTLNPSSDLVSDCVLREFGDALRIHHCFSLEPFSKDKFEYALERVANLCGATAVLAPRGNPGHDLTLNGVAFSLKTEASAKISASQIHISKFMELGRGHWSDQVEDLIGLRERFFAHMTRYQRILTLRRLKDTGYHLYELVEIPKDLLSESASGDLTMRLKSKQSPKPGYCVVRDDQGKVKFELYFDGGTERKLQIKHLNKSLCTVHATWKFEKGLAKPTQNIEA